MYIYMWVCVRERVTTSVYPMIAVSLIGCSYGSIPTWCDAYVCTYVYMYVCICIYMYVYERDSNEERVPDDRHGIDWVLSRQHLYVVRFICMYMFVYVCMHVCVCERVERRACT